MKVSINPHSQLDAVLEAETRKVVRVLVVCLPVQDFISDYLCEPPSPSIYRHDSSPDNKTPRRSYPTPLAEWVRWDWRHLEVEGRRRRTGRAS